MANTTTQITEIPATDEDSAFGSTSEPEQIDPDRPFLAKDSQSDVTVEQREKETRRGRPSSKGAPPGSAPQPTATQKNGIRVPDPKYKTYYSDSENPNQRTKAFWNWWNQLPTTFKERCVAYVYRDWPVLIHIDKDETDELSSIDCISGMEPIQNDADLNDRYGAGDFHIFFNEALLPGRRTLAKLFVKGSRDLKSRPPSDRRINDVQQIELTDPQNNGYVAYLRGRGMLPEQVSLKEKEGQVASIEAVREMNATVNKLTDKVINMAENKSRNSPGADETLKVLTQASINANEIQADAAKRSNEMLHETIRGMRELEQQSNGRGGGLGEALEVGDKLGLIGHRGGDSDEVKELRARLDKIQDDRMRALEEEVKAARIAGPAQAASSSPFGHVKEGLSALKEFKTAMEDLSGGKEPSMAEEVADIAGMPKWLPMVLQFGAPLLNNMLNVFLVSRGMTPGPMVAPGPMPGMGGMPGNGPGPFPGQPGQQPTPMPRPAQPSPPQPAQPGLPPAATAPTPSPEMSASGTPTYGLHPDIADLLFEIKTPLTQYIASGDATGEDYAGVFADSYGLEAFNTVAGFGVEGLMSSI